MLIVLRKRGGGDVPVVAALNRLSRSVALVEPIRNICWRDAAPVRVDVEPRSDTPFTPSGFNPDYFNSTA